MATTLSDFYSALTVQEDEFLPELADDNLGLILRVAINELDWFHYNIRRQDEPTHEQREQYYLLCLGVSRLIKLSLEARQSFDVPSIMVRRRRQYTMPALEIAAGLGMIEHGRRVAQTVAMGLCRIESHSKNNFTFALPAFIPDDDHYERAVSEHYRIEHRKLISQIFQSENGRQIEADVERMLTELVYPFQTHFIGYGASPLLDNYFYAVAYSELQMSEGYDTFGSSVRFGGISFLKYILSLTFFVSLFIRHERFAEALVKKDPTVKLENVLTISSEVQGFVESIRDAVNLFGSDIEGFEEMTLEEAQKVFGVLSVSRKNTALLDRPGSPLPLVVRCSESGFIRCLTGARSDPMGFLLNSLRFHFTRDYDQHQRSRENSLRAAVRRVLDEGLVGLQYLDNIKLRHGGRVLTDVDLVISEASTGIVVLCQLKHQELYGSDLHSRRIRAARLNTQVSEWFEALYVWTTAVSQEGLRASLRLPKSFPPVSLYRLIVSRHYAYPVRELANDDDVAYATWIQFFNAVELIKRNPHDSRRLKELFAILKKGAMPWGQRGHLPEPRTKWTIRDLTFVIEQEETPEGSDAQ